jgi:hypothetical protein
MLRPFLLTKYITCRLRLKCDRTRTETRFRLSAKRTSPFKSAGASVQSTTGSRGVRISGSNAGYTMFRGSVKHTGYPLHSPVTSSLPLPCVTVYHHISSGLYFQTTACKFLQIPCAYSQPLLCRTRSLTPGHKKNSCYCGRRVLPGIKSLVKTKVFDWTDAGGRGG